MIRRLAQENTDWAAPKIHGELQKLGVMLSERTVARYLSRTQRRGDARKKWLAFLHNHCKAIVAFDFFTVPMAAAAAANPSFGRSVLPWGVNARPAGR